MSDTTPKAAFDSLTLRSVAAVAVAFVASRLNIDLPPGAAQELVAAGINLLGTLGLIGAAIGRVRARQPIG